MKAKKAMEAKAGTEFQVGGNTVVTTERKRFNLKGTSIQYRWKESDDFIQVNNKPAKKVTKKVIKKVAKVEKAVAKVCDTPKKKAPVKKKTAVKKKTKSTKKK